MALPYDLDIGALYDLHREPLLVFLVRRTTDPELALDLWAETFAQAVAGQRKFRGSSDEEAAGWLYGIAKRQLAYYYRRGYARQRALHRLDLERQPTPPLIEDELVRRAGLEQLRGELAAALATLNSETRAAIDLRVVHGLPFAEVALRLSISEQAARARVSRGLRSLSHLLDQQAIAEVAQA